MLKLLWKMGEIAPQEQDGSRSLGLFRKGKIGIAKFHRTDLVI